MKLYPEYGFNTELYEKSSKDIANLKSDIGELSEAVIMCGE